MKKTAIAAALLLCLTLSSCKKPEAQPQEPIEPPKITPTIGDFTTAEIRAEIQKLFLAFPFDFDMPFDEGKANCEKVIEKMAAFGLTVQNYSSAAGLLNWEDMDQFCTAATSGEDAEITVYSSPYNYVNEHYFKAVGGKIYLQIASIKLDSIEEQLPKLLGGFTYTEKGNLIYNYPDTDIDAGYSYGFRVKPLPPTSIEYYEKYVRPAATIGSNALLVSWSKEDLSLLEWDWIFEGLSDFTIGDMYEYYSEYRKEGAAGELNYLLLPAEEVESLLCKYFPVSPQYLRDYISSSGFQPYNKETSTYKFTGFSGGGYSPSREVSKWEENSDGTLTLWVDFVSLEFGDELSAQSILTVRPDGEDVTFISCEYTPMHDN